MPEPVSSAPFHALVAALKEGGFRSHGDGLEEVLDGTWTTSSELIGEVGQYLLVIRKECRPLSPLQRKLLKQGFREVRKAWPGFAWWTCIPFL